MIEPQHLGILGIEIVEAAPDAILVTNAAGQIVLVNRQAELLSGYGRGELLQQSIELLVPEALRAAHASHRARYQEAPRTRPMGASIEVTVRRKDASEFPAEVSLSPVSLGGERFTISVLRDISARIAAQEQLRFLSTHDVLTGLYNRAFFEEEKSRLERGRQQPISVVVVDVDGLKEVNDQQGHAAGDSLIKAVAAALRAFFRAEDVVARIGGDEFVVLLPGVFEDALQERLRRLREQAGELSFSLGGAASGPGVSLSVAFRLADARMYDDKRRRKAAKPR